MNATIIAAVVRHVLTALAGGFAVRWGIDGGTVDAIVSGAAAAAGVGWSIWDKRRAQ
jgi:O-antigen/teichoic acid export membrane protein